MNKNLINKLVITGLSCCMLFSQSICTFATETSTILQDSIEMQIKQEDEYFFVAIPTETKDEYQLIAIKEGQALPRYYEAFKDVEIAAGGTKTYFFSNDDTGSICKKFNITASKLPYSLRCTVINRDTGITAGVADIDTTNSSTPFNLSSTASNYKFTVKNLGSSTGTFTFTVGTKAS